MNNPTPIRVLNDQLGNYDEAIRQTRYRRTILQALRTQAEADGAIAWITKLNQILNEYRAELNRLTAQRSLLRRKLDLSTVPRTHEIKDHHGS
jgi:hypothetical protein